MPAARSAPSPSRRVTVIRSLIVASEAVLILSLLATWLIVDGVRTGRSLTVLFFYSFPSEFLVGLVPHEPVLLFYGERYPALAVAAVAGISTGLAEWLNYSFLGYFKDVGLFDRLRTKAVVDRITRLFGRAPFLAIVIAGFTPVPFFPIRFLVVLEGYPVARYVLGVLVSRTPRFFLLAALGNLFQLPAWVLLALFAGLLVSLYLPLLRSGQPAPAGMGAAPISRLARGARRPSPER